MATCITCGSQLHPERAERYNYCLAAACQAENATGLTMVAVGVNKSAEQYEILDERTRQAMAQGRYHDQRRASFGSAPTSTDSGAPVAPPAPESRGTVARTQQTERPTRRAPVRRPWTRKQGNLALIYHEQAMRPDEIAKKVGLSRYTVTQIILGARPGPRR
jgi:hypothetical protein